MTAQRKVALVTGASSGLGVALAQELARRNYDLVLTARSEAPMREFARQLTDEYGIQVMVEPLDLARTCGAEELVARLDARGVSAAVLVNNAGFGLSQRFTAHDPERLRAMLQLNVTSLMT
jgi:hypothetical protein